MFNSNLFVFHISNIFFTFSLTVCCSYIMELEDISKMQPSLISNYNQPNVNV